jgi:hypothetical protein
MPRANRSATVVMAAVLGGLAACAAVAADGFVSGIADLPLMPGLTEEREGSLAFDTPAGRIVEATAAGDLGREAVVAFYAATLPQLGWRRLDETTYRREDEALRLEISEGPAGGLAPALTVRFSLAPAVAGGAAR